MNKYKGLPWDPPLSPMVANLFMEDLKARALSSSPNPPRIWHRFMDDTFIVYKAEHTQQLSPQTNMALFPSWTP